MTHHHKPEIYLIRHGETEWSLSGQHTSTTDIPLTDKGRQQAGQIAKRLEGIKFAKVFSSPCQRAMETCRLIGLMDNAIIDKDLAEWNYGKYEGIKTLDIQKEVPNWNIFTHGAPGGESVTALEKRVDHITQKLCSVGGDVAIISHGHLLRALAARWLGLSIAEGKLFMLGTAALCILGYDRCVDNPVIKLWNSTEHLR